MSTATLDKINGLPASSGTHFSLHEFLDKLLAESTAPAESDDYTSNLEVARMARAKRSEYLRTQRALAGY